MHRGRAPGSKILRQEPGKVDERWVAAAGKTTRQRRFIRVPEPSFGWIELPAMTNQQGVPSAFEGRKRCHQMRDAVFRRLPFTKIWYRKALIHLLSL